MNDTGGEIPMSRTTSLNHVRKYLEFQMRDEARLSQRERKQRPAPFITLSRQAGAGGVDLADRVASILNERTDPAFPSPWTVFDKNLVQAVVDEHQLPERVAKYMQEDGPSEIQDILEELFGLHISTHRLVAKTSKTVLRLASLGNAIIVGRGGSVVTRSLRGGFHVRVVGSRKHRLAHMVKYDDLTEEKAREVIREQDEARRSYMKKYFDRDIDDPLLYDLVINTNHLRPADTARLIVEASKIKATSVDARR
jgi:cytidylate kinase